jgi:hypothetical protein
MKGVIKRLGAGEKNVASGGEDVGGVAHNVRTMRVVIALCGGVAKVEGFEGSVQDSLAKIDHITRSALHDVDWVGEITSDHGSGVCCADKQRKSVLVAHFGD